MSSLRSYKDLIAWRKSIDLVKEVFLLTSKFPKSELFGLTSQMKRAVVSIPSNIAEGYGRKSVKQYEHFYTIAYGSALELETQIIIAKMLQFIHDNECKKADVLLDEVCRMLNTMSRKTTPTD